MFIPSTDHFDFGFSIKYYGDIPYSRYNKNTMDVFLPISGAPTGIIFSFHGGGFFAGDKTQDYSTTNEQNIIIDYLNNGIAFVTVNYRLIHTILDREGAKRCLDDGKAAVQFVIDNASFFNIDITKIALTGTSAGAGISLYVGFDDTLNIAGVACMETQSTYDLVRWEQIFSEFNIDIVDWTVETNTELSVLTFYGIKNLWELYTPQVQQYRQSIDMLDLMTVNAPEVYLRSAGQPAGYPDDLNKINHHPFHGRAVYQRALLLGVPTQLYAPELAIDTTEETKIEFLTRITT